MNGSLASESRWAYRTTWCMLALAFGFPIALMILNPTLMFKRGWEQYVGTAIYFWAVVALGRELRRLNRDETGFAEAPNYWSVWRKSRNRRPSRVKTFAF